MPPCQSSMPLRLRDSRFRRSIQEHIKQKALLLGRQQALLLRLDMTHVVVGATPCCYVQKVTIMVPHSSIRAKPKRHIFVIIPVFHLKDWQTADKFARRQPLSQPSAGASQHKHLHLCHPGELPARERAGRLQAPRQINRQAPLQELYLATRQGASCASHKSRYNILVHNVTLTTYVAAGIVNPDRGHARNHGSSHPDPRSQEPRISPFSLTCIRCRILKANNRPQTRTVVLRHTQPQHHLCELGIR